MRRSFAALALLPFVVSAAALTPVQSELATVLGFGEELARSPQEAVLFVRVFAVPLENTECERISSCPDVRLLIAVSNGDQGEKPVLFELPLEKGWVFVGWLSPSDKDERKVGLKLKTTFPGENIGAEEVKSWKPREYRVWVGEDRATYER